MTDLTTMRLTYARSALRRADLHADPVAQFTAWLHEALRAELPEPYAMTLATADAQGRPSARTVLLRGADARGFTFYTNYDSHKGLDLNSNPHAELLFYWPQLERQVRVAGVVERLSGAESDAYFHARPRESQLAAHASTPQSGVIANRAALEEKFAVLHTHYPEGAEVPRPAFWGGYRVVPDTFEFWQGRPNRMHDRFQYRRAEETWRIDRLMP